MYFCICVCLWIIVWCIFLSESVYSVGWLHCIFSLLGMKYKYEHLCLHLYWNLCFYLYLYLYLHLYWHLFLYLFAKHFMSRQVHFVGWIDRIQRLFGINCSCDSEPSFKNSKTCKTWTKINWTIIENELDNCQK